jgi:integrase
MKKPGTITQADAEKILGQLNPLQDRDIFWISCETGLRIGDILKLRVCDVQRNPLDVYESKSRRRRYIEISDELHQHLKQKYKYRFSFGSDNSFNLLFKSPRGTGKAINRSTYYRRLKRATTGLEINCSAHSGRKLYAKSIFERYGNVPAVQNAMNHKYITTTAAYLDIDLTKLLENYKPEEKKLRGENHGLQDVYRDL